MQCFNPVYKLGWRPICCSSLYRKSQLTESNAFSMSSNIARQSSPCSSATAAAAYRSRTLLPRYLPCMNACWSEEIISYIISLSLVTRALVRILTSTSSKVIGPRCPTKCGFLSFFGMSLIIPLHYEIDNLEFFSAH